MWTAASRKVGFRAQIPEVISGRTEDSSGIRKSQPILDRPNQVKEERVKVKAEKGIGFQEQINSLPTCVSPSSSPQAAGKDSGWQEITTGHLLKLWES